MWKQPEVHPEQQWVSEGSLDSSDVNVQLGGYKMLEREMQLLDYAQPARAGKSKKKYGIFLADFKKQLWVGNSEQTELKSTAAAGLNPPAFLEVSHCNQICFYLRKSCQESKLSTGKGMSGFVLLSQTSISIFRFLYTVSEYNMTVRANEPHGCLQKFE